MAIVSLEPFTILTASKSRRGVSYRTVVAIDGSDAVCNCPGFEFQRGTCSHTLAALTQWRDWQDSEEEPMTTALTLRDSMALAPVVVRPPTALVPTEAELRGMQYLAKGLAASSGFAIPRALDHPTKVWAIIYRGWELGVRPMVACNHMFVIDGKINLDGQLTMGVALSRDPSVRFDWVIGPSEEGCEVHLYRKRNGSEVKAGVGRFLKSDAMAAGLLNKPTRKLIERWDKSQSGKSFPVFAKNADGSIVMEEYDGRWQLYTSDMYVWKAIMRACRTGAPDLINGIEPVGAGFADENEVLPPVDMPSSAAQGARGAAQSASDAFSTMEHVPDAPEGAGDELAYIWFEQLTQLMAAPPAVSFEQLDMVVGGGDPDRRLERVEEWLFRIEVHDLSARVAALVKEARVHVAASAQGGLPL